jgi:DNA-directed RNA polymerase specialized sigma24 family protein
MKAGLTADSFAKLLECLDPDRERAGEKYETLRRVLLRYFEWRGVVFPEEHADEVFNRVIRKLSEGVEIKNAGGYCHEVARLIFLESSRGIEGRQQSLDSVAQQPAPENHTSDEIDERETRLDCLEECLRAIPAESARLILEYYDYDERGQIEKRREMAARLGLRREALANRAQRVRDKLEDCVRACRARKRTI